MRKILASSLSLLAIGSALVFGTSSFFSDTEASVDNTFTAGEIDLKIDNTEYFNNMECTVVDAGADPLTYSWQPVEGFEPGANHYPAEGTACTGTWALTDLTNERFFNYDDIKPEDEGMASISMHVINNDAWACMNVETTENSALVPTGNMSDGLSFYAWMDADEDGEFDELEEVLFGPASATDAMNTSIALADSTTGTGPLVGSNNEADASYIGVKWCAGSFDANLNCDGSTMTNEYQGGTFAANLTFEVVQSRNNEEFVCETDEPGVGGVVTVDAENEQWGFLAEGNGSTGTGQYVAGPTPAPIGGGSAELTVPDSVSGLILGTAQYLGTPLSSITNLRYSTYRVSGDVAVAPALQLNIDTNLNDLDVSWQGRLVYEPYHAHTVNTGVWETWNTLDDAPAGNWWFSGSPGNAVCPQSNPCTWTEVKTAFPNAGVHATLGGVMFKAGSGWTGGFVGNVDNFIIGINGVDTTYDFEN